MPHHDNIPMSRFPIFTQILQRLLRVPTIARDRLCNLLVHHDIDLDPLLRLPFQQAIQPPLPLRTRRPPQKQLGAQPPVLDVDDLARLLNRLADGPEVVASIDVRFDSVAGARGREGFVRVRELFLAALAVNCLLVGFVVAVVGVEDVFKFTEAVLGVGEGDFNGEEVRVRVVGRWDWVPVLGFGGHPEESVGLE